MNDLFEKAARQKLRFNSAKGLLTVEQLWDLPLTSQKGISLNEIGMVIQSTLRDMGQDSLVDVGTSPEKTQLKLSLDIIKHIISVKQAENAAARDLAEKRARKQKLMEALERKEDDALVGMSAEEIRKELESIDAA